MNDIVISIQKDILSSEISLSTILLKAKVLAHHLKNENFKKWVKFELDGYPNCHELPDYRIIRTQLFGYIFNGYNGYKNVPIPLHRMPDLFQETANKINFNQGIQAVEKLASTVDPISFDWAAEQILLWNHYNKDVLGDRGHQCYEVKRPVSESTFAQILLTVRSRLQDFVLELGDFTWKVEDSEKREQVENLVSVIIYNQQKGESMATFDQREQRVYNQNNAAHNIYNGNTSIVEIKDTGEFVRELQKLKSQLFKAGEAQFIDADLVTDIDYELANAIQEARKPAPQKESVLKPMERAKDLLSKASGATEFVTAIINLIAAGVTLW